MPIRTILLFALVLVCVAGPVAAQLTEKEAVKQVKAAAKTRLGSFKSTVDGAQATMLARIDALDAAVQGGGLTLPAVQTLADDVGDFQTAVQEALFRLAVDTAGDGKAVLSELAGGGVVLDEIPLALANLPGGLPEQVRTAVGKLLAKSYKTLNRRLAKTSTLVGKSGDATFFAVLAPPPQLHFAFSHLRSDAVLFDFALDVRISARTEAGLTRLWVGGTTAIDGVDLLVFAVSMSSAFEEDVQAISEGRGRFLVRLGDGLALAPSNYLVGAVPQVGTPTASASSSFAIR
jgi:hypothetical protein